MYFDKSFAHLKPNQYIRFMMCRRAAQEGLRYLNLGASPPGADGLTYYKRRWGGQVYQYRCLTLKRGLGRLR
jgi:hypothetical protein